MDIDISKIYFAIAIILLTFFAGYLFRRLMSKYLIRSSVFIQNDPTKFKFLLHTATALIYVVGFSWAIFEVDALRAVAGSVLAGAGILAVAVGFASQHALGNIVSGIFLIIFKPFKINDRLVIKDTLQGVVEDITLRHTVIRDFQNKRIVIPNSIISNEIIVNADLSEEKVCRFIDIGISYDTDIKHAKKVIREVVMAHPSLLDNRNPEQVETGDEVVNIRVISYGESSINLRAYAWAADQAEGFNLHCDVLENLKERFDQEGIEIPFSYRTLVFKNKLEIGNQN